MGIGETVKTFDMSSGGVAGEFRAVLRDGKPVLEMDVPHLGFVLRLFNESMTSDDGSYLLWRIIEAEFQPSDRISGMTIRVENTEEGPKVIDLRFRPKLGNRNGITKTMMRKFPLNEMAEVLAAMGVAYPEVKDGVTIWSLGHGGFEDPEMREKVSLIRKLSAGVTTRDITQDSLREVADIYRDNIAGAPTKAVQARYDVAYRTAASYVTQARQRGFLPPTKRGKKNA